MLFEVRVEDGCRCLPACTRRSVDDGEDVRIERRWARFEMVVSSGTVMGIVSPDKTLTKICIDSDCNSGEADLDEVALEGVYMMMMVVMVVMVMINGMLIEEDLRVLSMRLRMNLKRVC